MIIKWVKRKIALLVLAISNVEKNALNNSNSSLVSATNQTKKHSDGQLADSLINGKITEDVKDLRWRTYKILKKMDGVKANIIGYTDDDDPIVKLDKINKKDGLSDIVLEPTDNYELDLVINNDDVTLNTNEIINNSYLEILDVPAINKDKDGKVESATLATIDGEKYFATFKTEKMINIVRKHYVKFNIEKYTQKLHVRIINDKERLLEFYINKLADYENKNNKLFLNELKKIHSRKYYSNLFEFTEINFISNNTLGANDNERYVYENIRFDKIVDFNGYYVIKFICDVTVNGEDIFKNYVQEALEEKYKNKQKK